MKKIIFAILFWTFCSGKLFAQAPDSTAADSLAADSTKSGVVEVPIEKAEDIYELFEVSGLTEGFEEAYDYIVEQYKKAYPQVAEGYWKRWKKNILNRYFYSPYVPVYHKCYTHEEIRELIRFYKSPVGKKLANFNKANDGAAMKIGDMLGARLYDSINKNLEKNGFKPYVEPKKKESQENK